MAQKYYILKDGQRYYADTIKDIRAMATQLANATGLPVKVNVTSAVRRAVGGAERLGVIREGGVFARNPAPKTIYFTDTHSGKMCRLIWVPESPYAKAHWKFTGYDGHMRFADQPMANITNHLRKDGYIRKAAKKFTRNPVMQGVDFTGEQWKITGKAPRGGHAVAYANSKREAEDEARLWRQHGVVGIQTVRLTAPMQSNPTRAAKARKSAAHKRGAYVVWRQEGREQRQKFANKGLATIEERKMREAGYAGVRVIGA